MATLRRIALVALLLALLVGGAAAEDEPQPAPVPQPEPAPAPEPAPPPGPAPERGGGPPPGVDRAAWRESMWPAPSAADWEKPVLLEFQRSWDDAVAVSKETGKPILICINMDGEIASEHYAGIRYRSPEIAELYKPYVCVIASVYRHNPRDYDDEGNRILCPRFGSVTCGEHIGIEPTIYEKYCEGQRIAPRHIAVDLEGGEVYDVFYANDTASVFAKIKDGIQDLPAPNPTIVRGDRPILERVASRHVEDREAVEAAYKKADKAMREQLLEAVGQHVDKAQLDVLRLAIFGLDVDLSKKAREVLTKIETPRATELISEAMQVPMEATEREALIATLRRLGESNKLAAWLAGVHSGLAAHSNAVDPTAWTPPRAGGTYPAPTPDADALVWRAEDQAKAAEQRPDDPAPRLEFAQASLALALKAGEAWPTNERMARRVARASFEEARGAAQEAAARGATGWPVEMVLTLASYYLGDTETAYAHAAKAMEAVPSGDNTWNSMAVVTVFAESRWKAIKAAVQEKKDWPAEWLADLHAAYALLQRHPLGTDQQVVWHYEFLMWLGAYHRASQVLTEGLTRFDESPALHQRLRDHLLKRRGIAALENAYVKLREKAGDTPAILWFSGLAEVDAARALRNTRKLEAAMDSYGKAVDDFEKAIQVDEIYRPLADPAIALALAGRARIAYQLEDDATALKDILASFARSPDTAGTRDEMGITPGETGQMLLARLKRAEKAAEVETLQAALDALDPELLIPDRP